MKTDRRFHCFGCNADGDVIDFAARLFSLSPKDAAMKLADDFAIAELLAFVTNDDDESEQVRHEYKTILEAMLSVRKLFTVNE